jgi:hypothetical protein
MFKRLQKEIAKLTEENELLKKGYGHISQKVSKDYIDSVDYSNCIRSYSD